MNDIPVVLFFFKRNSVLNVLQSIKTYAPSEIYLVADGGRTPEEHLLCLSIRELVEKEITWPVKVHRLYRDFNSGCRRGIPQGLDWVFEKVDAAIILEDDTVPSPKFFPFCVEMLNKYRNDTRIWLVSGSNFLTQGYSDGYSYLFSGYAEQWGWATWKRCWVNYDNSMALWPLSKRLNLLGRLFLADYQSHYWSSIFQSVFDCTCSCDPYDYQWLFLIWSNHGLSIVPDVNLVSNIGFNIDATHCKDVCSPLANVPWGGIKFPLDHPPFVVRNARFDEDYGALVFYGKKQESDNSNKNNIFFKLYSYFRRIASYLLNYIKKLTIDYEK